MLEKPDLPEEVILAGLHEGWGFTPQRLDFLPLGNDATAWVYRASGAAQDRFLKLKRGTVNRMALIVPDLLHRRGLRQAVAPLPALDGRLWVRLGSYHLILYPFIEGPTGMQIGLNAAQQQELGAAARAMHSLRAWDLPVDARRYDAFHPPWSAVIRRIDERVAQGGFDDPLAAQAAEFWTRRREEIAWKVDFAESSGARLRVRAPEAVLCHGDLHTANVLVDSSGGLHLVDWDEAILAPKERDLMFTLGEPGEQNFMRGYDPEGALLVDPLALEYYRAEWDVQEIGDFGERIFFRAAFGEATRRDSILGLMKIFEEAESNDPR